MRQSTPFPGSPEELTDPFLNSYVEKFLDIGDFKSIDNGKGLLEMIRQNPDHPKIKPAIRKVIGLFACDVPAGKVCALQFLKEALEAGSFFTVENIEKSVLPQFAEILQYRSSIKNIMRGSTYFIREIDKNLEDDDMMNLMKLSSTFFRMVHECLYVWGAQYFPGSSFDRLRIKMEKKVMFPEYPKDFKFFSETKINNFKERCTALIKRVEEKAIAAQNSLLTKRSESIIKEKQVGIGSTSPRSIKKTKELPPKMQPPKNISVAATQEMKKSKIIDEKEEKQLQLLEKEAAENPPSSKRSKRHKPKKAKASKKQLVELIKQEISEKTISNNSSKIRKKNSFNEVPIGLMQANFASKQVNRSANNSSSSDHKKQQMKSRPATSKNGHHIQTIDQNEQSDGGRYSMQETISKSSQLSQIQYDYNREVSSPRSQYSLANKQKEQFYLKRENSDQLPPSIHIIGKSIKKQAKVTIKHNQNQTNKQPQVENMHPQQKIHHKSQNKKQPTFKLPLDQIKKNMDVIPSKPSQSEEQTTNRKAKKQHSTARKKFVSSQEQSTKEVKHESKPAQKMMALMKQFDENQDLQYQNIPKKPIKQQKKNVTSSSKGEQVLQSIPPPPKPKQAHSPPIQSTKSIPQMPAKAPKPVKLKSKANLKTVFESSDYKIVDNVKPAEPEKDKLASQNKESNQKKGNSANSNLKNIEKQTKVPQSAKEIGKRSIFESVEIDTIETINDLTPITYKPDTRQSSPTQKIQQPSQNYKKEDNISEQLIQQPPANRRDVPKNQIKPTKVTQGQSLPKKQEIITPVNHSSGKLKASEDTQVPKISNQRRSSMTDKVEDSRSIRSVRNEPQYSSRRFRQFKEVNLFIEPKQTQTIGQKQIQAPPLQPDNTFGAAFKQQILSQISKLKSAMLEKQEEALNQTLLNYKSSITHEKTEISTQTIRHRSKSKFQRRSKFKLEVEGSLSEQNISQQNIPKDIPIINEPPKLPQQITTNKSKTSIQKQQLKPNTLLYAIFRRKSLNNS